jgi:hypothetical protein
MPKLDMDKARSSKLNPSSKKTENIEIISRVQKKILPTSLRLTSSEKDLISNIAKKVNRCTSRRISESDIIRSLINISKDADLEKIIKSYKEII